MSELVAEAMTGSVPDQTVALLPGARWSRPLSRRLTKHRATLGMAILVLVAGAACAEGPTSTTPDSIVVGAVLDITGVGAVVGVPERQTLELLTKQLNDSGGVDGRRITLVVEDDQSTEEGAAKAVNKLISQDGADLLIGAGLTSTSLAMRDIAEQYRVPMISLASSTKIVEGKQWVFKTAQDDAVVTATMIDVAAKRGWKTLGLVRDSSGFGAGVLENLTSLGTAHGIRVVVDEKYAPDATDFTAQMLELRAADADANVIWGGPPAAMIAQKAYRQLGIDAPVMQSHGVAHPVFLQGAGEAANGTIVPMGRMVVYQQLPDSDPQKSVIDKFVTSYRAAYNDTPPAFAGHAYDAFQLAVAAFSAIGTDREKVRDHLMQVKGFVGCTGVFDFTTGNRSGLDTGAIVIVVVEDGAFKLVTSG